MDIDFEKVSQRFKDIEQCLAGIRQYAAAPDDVFFSDSRNILAVKQLLLQAIEAVSAVCLHLSARLLRKSADSPADCISKLVEGKIITPELGSRLGSMAKFRNKLVHHYATIDDTQVLQYARGDLGDFELFMKSVGQLLRAR